MTRLADDPAQLRARLRELPPAPPDADVLGELRARRGSRRRLSMQVLVPALACAAVAVVAFGAWVLPDQHGVVAGPSPAECPTRVGDEPPVMPAGELKVRGAAAFIPDGWESASVCSYAWQYGELGATPPAPVAAGISTEQVTDIAARLQRLPQPKGVTHCVADDGSGYLLQVSYPSGVLEVWVGRTGCQRVTNGVRHGLWADNVGALKALAGVVSDAAG